MLPMSMIDPLISEVAWPLWLVGKYCPAVDSAATSLDPRTVRTVTDEGIGMLTGFRASGLFRASKC